jgi:hypothetical protein
MTSPTPQILRGEKFAVLALSNAWTKAVTSPANLSGGLWILTAPPVDVGDTWREWLGSIRADEIADANLWFLAKRTSGTPGISDQESEELKDEVWRMFLGLWIIGPLWFEGCYLLGGGNVDGVPTIRQFTQAEPYLRSEGAPEFSVTDGVIQDAVSVSAAVRVVYTSAHHMRLRGGLSVFWKGLRERYAEARLHQFVRAVEAVVKPDIGRSKNQFVHRCQTFAGANSDAVSILQECYDLRSQQEHLHDWQDALVRYPPGQMESVLYQRVRQMEALARYVYFRILTSLAHMRLFADTSIDAFWVLGEGDQRSKWGPPLDIRTIG